MLLQLQASAQLFQLRAGAFAAQLLQLRAAACVLSSLRSRTWRSPIGGQRCRGSEMELLQPPDPALPPRAPGDIALPCREGRPPESLCGAAGATRGEAVVVLSVEAGGPWNPLQDPLLMQPGAFSPWRGRRRWRVGKPCLPLERGSVLGRVRPLCWVSTVCCFSPWSGGRPRLRLDHGSLLGRVVRPLRCTCALSCCSLWRVDSSCPC